MDYQAQGIILRKTDWKETGQLFSIYTKDFGKIEAVSRGSKKILSKLNCHLQFFAVVDLSWVKAKTFDQLTGALISENFINIKNDLKKIMVASFGLELVDKLTKQNQPDEKIFILLTKFLGLINDNLITSAVDEKKVKELFIIKLMGLLGYEPKGEVTQSSARLKLFLKDHLDQELKTDRFMEYFRSQNLYID